jgi:heme/copper-type cytochrome/quinol oxidase subunit 3
MTAAPRAALAPTLPLDRTRGTNGMWLFIISEATLFLLLFFSYFYLARNQPRWPMDEPPKLLLASIMLVVLLVSSGVLYLGEEAAKQGRMLTARLWVLGTVVLAVAFLVIQGFEYADHLKTLKPTTNAYGSIFYTITSFHAAHLLLGLAMLVYVLLIPELEHTDKPPHRPLHNAAMYWHFVDAVWVVIVGVLYVTPRFLR